MGAFALCVENATRDIHSLLTLHCVHPQVQTDINRVLSSLLRKTYENMAVMISGDLTESSEQVCRALVNHVVEDVFRVALPASDNRALERHCVEIEDENAELRAMLREAKERVEEVQEVLVNLKKAHDYMLHSYFAEVLVLRHRIDELQRQAHLSRGHSGIIIPCTTMASPVQPPPTLPQLPTMESQIQQFTRQTSATASRAASIYRSSGSCSTSPKVFLSEVVEEGGTERGESAERWQGSSTAAGSDGDDKEGTERPSLSHAGAAVSSQVGVAETSRAVVTSAGHRKDRHTHNLPLSRCITFTTAAPQTTARTSVVVSKTSTEVVVHNDTGSVDAIFDYEKYIQILNGKHGAWEKRYAGAVDGTLRSNGRLHCRSFDTRLTSRSDAYFPNAGKAGAVVVPVDSTEVSREEAKTKGFHLLLHLALEPLQHDLKKQLGAVRQAIVDLQREHAEQVLALQRALLSVQSRSDALLEFLFVYVRETRQTMDVLARDAQAQNMIDLLSNGVLPLPASQAVRSFFACDGVGSFLHRMPTSSVIMSASLSSATTLMSPENRTESVSMPNAFGTTLHPRKKMWRLKPMNLFQVQEAAAAAQNAKKRRHGKVGIVSNVPSFSKSPSSEAEKENYYRADLGFPFWSTHPITAHAQKAFGEMQEIAAAIRAARVKQIFAYEDGMAADGGRRVRWGGRAGSSLGEGSDGHSHRSSSLKEGQSVAVFYFRHNPTSPDDPPGSLQHSRRLEEGWRSAVVHGAKGETAEHLLRELTGLRMRRAVDQTRMNRLKSRSPHYLRQDDASTLHDTSATLKVKKAKPPAQGILSDGEGGKTAPPMLSFTTPEEVMRLRVLEHLRVLTQKRLNAASRRIAELQRLLDLHLEEHQIQEVEDTAALDAAREIADEERRGLFRVNGVAKTAEELWNSPYLNNSAFNPKGQESSQGGNGDGMSRQRVMFLPIGLAGACDAEGRTTGGAGACVVLDGTEISASPFLTCSPAEMAMRGYGDGGACEDDAEARPRAALSSRSLPFTAVMDYCRGVQMGQPAGRRGGPVYLVQHPENGAYYVANQNGDDLSRWVDAANERGEGKSGASPVAEEDGNAEPPSSWPRPELPMTRIIFPAPRKQNLLDTAPIEAPEDANTVAAALHQRTAEEHSLHPLYLVPMAVPLSDEEAVVREGWQASHRHGHTRRDPIFYTTVAPIPLSTSYHRLVPSSPTPATTVEGARSAEASGSVDVNFIPTGNRYLHVPPRVFRPADEVAEMVRVCSLQPRARAPGGGNAEKAGPAGVSGPPASAILSMGDNEAPLGQMTQVDGRRTAYGLSCQGNEVDAAVAGSSKTASKGSASAAVGAVGLCAAPPFTTSVQGVGLSPPVTLPTGGDRDAPTASRKDRHGGAENALNVNAGSGAAAGAAPPPATLIVVKEQRRARLGHEAASEGLSKTSRQDPLRNRAIHLPQANTPEGETARGPPHRLAPLMGPHLRGAVPSFLPAPGDATRIQRLLRPEKYALTVPPRTSRWKELCDDGAETPPTT